MPHRSLWFRSLLVALAMSVGATLAPASAPAQFAVLDVANLAQAVLQVQEARNQVERQIQALKRLPAVDWRLIQALTVKLETLSRQGVALDMEFQQLFPGYLSMAPVQKRAQAQRVLLTMRSTLRASQIHVEDARAGQATLMQIKNRIGGVEGTQGALELQAAISGYLADEAATLRQAVAAGAQAEAVWRAYQLQQQEQSRAAHDEMIAATRASPPGPQTINPAWRVQ